MYRLISVSLSLLLFTWGAPFARALTVKPNVAPVVTTPMADYQQYAQSTRLIDLTTAFKDPDASAAVRMGTVLGTMNVTLDGETAPLTVANFLNYLNSGRYFMTDPTNGQLASLFFHRSVPGFVIQSGGFLGTVNPANPEVARPSQVAAFPAVPNEPVISNTRGTIAMAKIGGQPNSATSQWFINLANNGGGTPGLDTNESGYTVFGRVAGNGMAVADAIAALPRYNFGAPFSELPLRNFSQTDYNTSKPVRVPNLVSIPELVQIPPLQFSAFSSNTNVATVSVSGSKLSVNALQVGLTSISVTATDLDGATVSRSFNVNVSAAPGRLINISTRLQVRTGDEVLIGGFIMQGAAPKRLLIRAIGPSLSGQGISDRLLDPQLELYNSAGNLVASNDNWGSSNRQAIIDTQIPPSSESESAILTTLPSSKDGVSYTAIVRGANGTSGVALVEVYDLDTGPGSTLVNISTRGRVGTEDEKAMIGGFFVGGTQAKRILIRALGPSLQGVPGTLTDPRLELRDSNENLVVANDDWQTSAQAAEIQASGIAPKNPKESAALRSLVPGSYTAIVRTNTAGVGSVEIYQLP